MTIYGVWDSDLMFASKEDWEKYQNYCNTHPETCLSVYDDDVYYGELFTFEEWLKEFEGEKENE